MADAISDRMKNYERSLDVRIVPHIPTILRIDGKAFHTYTKGCEKPYDFSLQSCFICATQDLYRTLHYDLAFGQSDEVSLLIYRPDTFSQEDFEGRLFKLASITASAFTAYFNKTAFNLPFGENKVALFDCRVFQLPQHEVINYFIWRQQDATRNSIQMLGQSEFSQKQLHGKSCSNIQDMLMTQKNINWNDTPTSMKRGWCIDKNSTDKEIPIFTEDKKYVEQYLETKEKESIGF